MSGARLAVRQIDIRNVLGVSEKTIEAGKVTVVSGRNGSSKSSILEALQAALRRGSLANLKRIGAADEDEPEVVLVLEGGGEAYRVRRRGDSVDVTKRVGQTAGFEPVPRPVSFLQGITDSAANPVAFLTAPDKERALLLLEALPLTMDRAALLERMQMKADELPPVPESLHPLEQCDLIRDAVYRRRRGVNVDAQGKRKAAEQTRREIPAEEPPDLSSKVADLQGRTAAESGAIARLEAEAKAEETRGLEDAKRLHAEQIRRVQEGLKSWAENRRSEHRAKAEEIRAAAERRISELAAEMEVEIEAKAEAVGHEARAFDEQREAAVAEAREKREIADAAIELRREGLDKLREQLHEATEAQRQGSRFRALHEQARAFDAEAERLEAEHARLDFAIKALDIHRRTLADEIPIPGLTIEGSTIRVDGIPFDQLNTAQRVRVAVKVATLRAQHATLPLLFVDGAEALDAEQFGLLVSELEAANVQSFVARVEDHDLSVDAHGSRDLDDEPGEPEPPPAEAAGTLFDEPAEAGVCDAVSKGAAPGRRCTKERGHDGRHVFAKA